MQWIQPVLTANDSDSDFIVSSGGGADSTAWRAFDSSLTTYVNKMNADAFLQFVTKDTISISAVTIFSNDKCLPAEGIFQVSYDDGETWLQVGAWTDTNATSISADIVFDSAVEGNYFRIVSKGRSIVNPRSNADISNVVITAELATFNFTIDTSRKIKQPLNFNVDFVRKVTDVAQSKIDTDFLKVWLQFNHDATTDFCGNIWTAHNSPFVSTYNSFYGKALQLAGGYNTRSDLGQYLSLDDGITLGGKDFTVDGWVYIDKDCSVTGEFEEGYMH